MSNFVQKDVTIHILLHKHRFPWRGLSNTQMATISVDIKLDGVAPLIADPSQPFGKISSIQ